MMIVAVFGGDGRLAKALKAARNVNEVVLLPRLKADVRVESEVEQVFAKMSPSVVINCAVVTTEVSERDHDAAWQVNVVGAIRIAQIASDYRARLVHISTDYVFDGEKGLRYLEGDVPNPLNYYGFTKACADVGVLSAYPATLVLRAPFRYGPPWPYERAFVDQYISGRFIGDVAPLIWREALDHRRTGILHIPAPRVSVYELARSVSPSVGKMLRRDCTTVRLPADVALGTCRG